MHTSIIELIPDWIHDIIIDSVDDVVIWMCDKKENIMEWLIEHKKVVLAVGSIVTSTVLFGWVLYLLIVYY